MPMSRDAAYEVANDLVLGFPASKVGPDTIAKHWLPRLINMSEPAARAAVEQIVDADEFFPSVAHFRDVYRTLALRMQAEHPPRFEMVDGRPVEVPELDVVPSSPEVTAAGRAAVARAMDRASGPLAAGLRSIMAGEDVTPRATPPLSSRVEQATEGSQE